MFDTGYRCECTGAVGDNCERELNECISGPCSEGSLCIDEHNGYVLDKLRSFYARCHRVDPKASHGH